MEATARRAVFYVLLLLAWEAVVQLRVFPEHLFPSPFTVLAVLRDGIVAGTYLSGALVSLARIVVGYGLSVLIGITLGSLLARSALLEQTAGSLVAALQGLPSICWLPLALLWFGLNETAILFVVVIGSVLSVTMATLGGIKRVPPIFTNAARTMGARGAQLHFNVTLPAAWPSIVEGMKQGWSFAWRSLMGGELLFSFRWEGLGHHLQLGRELNDMARVMAVMILIMGVGIVFDRLVFGAWERRLRERWGLAGAGV